MLLQSLSNLLLLSLALALLLLGNQVYAFQSPPVLLSAGNKNNRLKNNPTTIHRCNTRIYSISNSGNDSSSEGEEELEKQEGDDDGCSTANNNNIFAALPPIGTSSFWDRQDDDDNTNENNNTINLSSNNIVVSRKFHLSYTCKLCDTRNTHSITRLGYNHGVVIAVCKCCHSKHLIADNLGWSNYLVSGFDYDGGERNIEDHVKNKLQNSSGGESDDDVDGNGDVSLRVDRGVFDLESLWHEEKDVNNEAVLIDEDGEDWN